MNELGEAQIWRDESHKIANESVADNGKSQRQIAIEHWTQGEEATGGKCQAN